jgi:2-polyprenyl-3-methyl-5-hydroxy-6-metoxy-1,4-benzoquinol methylase
MPLYKYVGNKILTWFQNRLLRSSLSEFHSGYRVYSVEALKRIPFDLNTNLFHFDSEIIIQFVRSGLRILELPIPTYYGDEICYVNGMKYAWDVVLTTLRSRAQDFSLFYDRKFDCAQTPQKNAHYTIKLDYMSPHRQAIDTVGANQRVLDMGCASGYMGAELKARGCHVTGIDLYPANGKPSWLDRFIQHDLNSGELPVSLKDYDFVLILDAIEHLANPESFVGQLREAARSAVETKILVSTGNIGFFIPRLMLILGQLNYGKRGILDITHTRLFTFSSFRRLFEQAGFEILEERGMPAPFGLVIGNRWVARMLYGMNTALLRVWRSMFSYQIFLVVRPLPSLHDLLQRAYEHSELRSQGGTAGPHL